MTSPTEIPEALKAKAREVGDQVIYCLADGATKIVLAALLQVRNEAIAEERERTLDAACEYMYNQYGNSALGHPTDRARVLAIRARP